MAGLLQVRPVRPDDESLYEEFFRHVSADDMRLRFFGLVKDIGHAFIARLTQIDYGRSIALLALDETFGRIDRRGAAALRSRSSHWRIRDPVALGLQGHSGSAGR
jgi:acetyltransferase